MCRKAPGHTKATITRVQSIPLGLHTKSASPIWNADRAGSHSHLVGGVVVVGKNKELADQIAFLQNSVGAIAGAFDSFLVLRSLKTLALRLERHCSNALEIARWLEDQREIKSVHYPGLKSHPQHDLARQQMRGFGGMVSMILKTDLAGTRRFLENTKLFALAESLGGVESLFNHPALMTHA